MANKCFIGWNYFGAQGKLYQQLKNFIEKHIGVNWEKFADLTAGGGGQIYQFAKDGKVVYANDAGYYSYLCNKAMLTNIDLFKVENIINNVEPKRNFLYKNWKSQVGDKQLFKGSEKVTSWIDGLLLKTSNELVLANLGKTLIDIYGYMGNPVMCVTMADKTKSSEYPLAKFKEKLKYNILRSKSYCLNSSKNITTWKTATEASKNKFLKNCVVYADPAWPYDKSLTTGDIQPYFNYTKLSFTLSRGKQEFNHLWGTKTTDLEIMQEVSNWINNAFEKKALCFIVNTQSTNRPSVDFIKKYLKSKFGDENVLVEIVNSKTYKKLKKEYTLKEYYFLIKNTKQQN